MALVQCPDCQKEVSDSAKSCPNCGRPMGAQAYPSAVPQPPKKSRWLRNILIAFGLLVALSMLGNALKSSEEKAAEAQKRAEQATKKEEAPQQSAASTTQDAPKDPCANIKSMDDWNDASTLWRKSHPECQPKEDAKTYTVIAATALWKEFDKNEVAAEKTYKNKRVAISGRIHKIETSLMGYPEIVFDVAYGIQTVRCQFSKKDLDTIAGMSKGQKVIVIGTVKHFTLGSMLSLDDCVFGQ